MEDQATRFFFGWLPNEDYVPVFVMILFSILVGIIILGSYYYIRYIYIKNSNSFYLIYSFNISSFHSNNIISLIRQFDD